MYERLIPEVPELRAMADRKLANEILRAAVVNFNKRRARFMSKATAIFMIIFLSALVVVKDVMGIDNHPTDLLLIFGSGILFYVCIYSLKRREIRLEVRAVLKKEGDRCLGCGYCIEGVRSGQCPECGERIDSFE